MYLQEFLRPGDQEASQWLGIKYPILQSFTKHILSIAFEFDSKIRYILKIEEYYMAF